MSTQPTAPKGGRRPTSDKDRREAEKLGKRVRKLRADMSLRAAAKKAGISVMCWHGIEHGSNPTYPTLKRVASALNVSISELLEGASQQ